MLAWNILVVGSVEQQSVWNRKFDVDYQTENVSSIHDSLIWQKLVTQRNGFDLQVGNG